MNRATEKAMRLLQIEQLLWAHPEGLTRTEVAKRLEINRSNITKYLNKDHLPPSIYIDDLDGNKLKIDRNADLTKTSFNLHEIMAIHLATRLLATRTDKQNPHAASALRKLGMALQRLDGRISHHLLRSADVMDEDAAFRDPVYLDALQKLTEAWSSGRKVSVSHQMPDGKVFDYTFSPYFIEPYAIGQTAHVIGLREPPGKIRTFKIERLRSVEILREEYTIPDSFDAAELLRNAWGIWYSEAEPEQVLLRFHPTVASRVQETRWHREQRHELQPDGYLLWRAKVAEPQEMLPWVRGWGADVEVVEPVRLRRRMIQTFEGLGDIYAVQPLSQRQPYQWLYAKTDRNDSSKVHLLLYHLIDVGQVALTMWNEVFPDSFRSHISQLLNLSTEQAGQFVAFIASLHDLGKASPAYQKKYSPTWLKEKLFQAGFILDDPHRYSAATNDKMTSHAYITTWTLPPLLVKYCGLDDYFSRKIGQALGGHHGAWPINSVNFNFDDSACPAWNKARCELVWELRSVFQPPIAQPPASDEELNVFLTLVSGLVSVADWLGSRDDEHSFPFVSEVLTTCEYAHRSQLQARKVLRDLGWLGWMPNQQAMDFGSMFAYLAEDKVIEPRPVQSQIIELTANLAAPCLIIVEAPTGIGKTEIAYYLADALLQNHQGRGLYIAMPTQATSNQMFERTSEFLSQRYPKELVNLQLAHGQAMFDEQLEKMRLQTIGDDETEGRVVAMSWFNEKSKRTVLAPFGVGTVDQTLMSVLQTKHFFVRLLGLSHKVIIFDEVHAYDTYMSTLFLSLLQWLRAIGTSVIMLSATLPAETRRKFVQAFTGQRQQLDNHYPAITLASATEPAQIHPLPSPEDIALEIDWLPSDQQIDHILSLADKGGCIAVICNTVARTQRLYRELLDAQQSGQLEIDRDNLILFHARFPPIWRQDLENRTRQLFGKPQKDADGRVIDYRPPQGPAIIVATQVIEQSLDLDFDAMITDLAPIDLLIQRAGRLHRHAIRDTQRHGHRRQLTILQSEVDEKDIPHFGDDELIYERYILLRTYRALQRVAQNNVIALPKQTTELIEAVYSGDQGLGDEDPTWQAALKEAQTKMKKEQRESQHKAGRQVIEMPSCETLLYDTNMGLEEDNPTIHQTFQAKTRDIGPTLALICLHASEAEDFALLEQGDASIAFDLNLPPNPDLTKALLQRRINVQQWPLLNHFLAEDAPPNTAPSGWRKSSVLRYARAVIFKDGKYQFSDDKYAYTLTLDRDYGLALAKQLKGEVLS